MPIENDENDNLIDDREEASIGMDAARDFDFDRAVQLMTAIEKCATVGVKATSIAGLAQAALNEMNEEAKDIAKKRAEAFAKREADARARAANVIDDSGGNHIDPSRDHVDPNPAVRRPVVRPSAPDPRRL